jgi:hypothetical protein
MSTTGFKISTGDDLSNLFQPRTTTKRADVGFIASDGRDISNWFETYTSGSTKAPETKYKISDGSDLNLLFKKIGPYTATGATLSSGTINNISYNTILTYTSVSSNTFTALVANLVVNYYVVGGGGSGSFSSTTSYNYYSGGGGGGGKCSQSSFIPTINTSYTISIGSAGYSSAIGSVVTANPGQNAGYQYGGYSGSGKVAGKPTTTSPYNGGGGGGDTTAGSGSTGGTGFTFNGRVYGSGGAGGKGGGNKYGAAGGANTGNGGGGGDGSLGSYTQGGLGGSGIVILYFNV